MLDDKIITFLKVAELGSYTAAAQALHMTQPAVTQQVRKLEEHYRCKLFDISGRVPRLTETGKVLVHYAKLQNTNEQQLLSRLEGVLQPVRIGATLSIADYYLPGLLPGYLGGFPGNFSVTVGNTGHLVADLVSGALECAFLEGAFDKSLFTARVFCEARFLPLVSAAHPLAGKAATLRQLHDYPLVLREEGSGTRAVLESYLAQRGDTAGSFARVIELGSFMMIKQLVRDSNAVTFLYEAVAQREVREGSLSFLKLRGCSIQRPLHFVYLKNSMMKDRYDAFYRALVDPSLKDAPARRD